MKRRIEDRSRRMQDPYADQAGRTMRATLPASAAKDTNLPYRAGCDGDDSVHALSMWKVCGSYLSRVVRWMPRLLLPATLPFPYAPHGKALPDIVDRRHESHAGPLPVPADTK